jgi:hypothetical protein
MVSRNSYLPGQLGLNELLSSYPIDKMSFFLAKPSKRFDSQSQILSKKSFPRERSLWENYPKILTFSSVLLPEENMQHTCKWDTRQKIQPPIINNPPALFLWRFSSVNHTHQSPPSYPDLVNQRNLVLQEHTPRNSLLRLMIFLLPKWRPIAIRSTAHSLQFFVDADFRREMVFDRQMILISRLDWH